MITDSTGAKVQTLTYYPYSDLRTNQSFTTPAIDVLYKFTGKELAKKMYQDSFLT